MIQNNIAKADIGNNTIPYLCVNRILNMPLSLKIENDLFAQDILKSLIVFYNKDFKKLQNFLSIKISQCSHHEVKLNYISIQKFGIYYKFIVLEY